MKKILISESQFSRLFEDSNVPDFNGGDIEEYPGSEISATAHVTNADGDTEYGKEPTTDDIANKLTPQQWGAKSGRRGGFAPI